MWVHILLKVKGGKHMRYWDSVEAATNVINNHGLLAGKSHGLVRYREEGVGAMIQQAALDFLSTEFKGFPKDLVIRDLSDRESELYGKWISFAKKVYGINSIAGQQTGWEMIMGGPYGDPGLTDFPKRGALHQSRELMNEDSPIEDIARSLMKSRDFIIDRQVAQGISYALSRSSGVKHQKLTMMSQKDAEQFIDMVVTNVKNGTVKATIGDIQNFILKSL